MSNGEPILVRAAMKPIPTTITPLRSVDLATGEAAATQYQRSDVCAVPAASIVGEAMVAWVLADALLAKVDAALIGLGETGQAAQQGGFAAAAGAQKGEELSLGDLQAHVVYRHQFVKTLGYAFEGNTHHVSALRPGAPGLGRGTSAALRYPAVRRKKKMGPN